LYIIIAVNRHDENGEKDKNDLEPSQHILVPTSPVETKTYELLGMVSHTGDLATSGHYFVECNRPVNLRNDFGVLDYSWIKLDNEKIWVIKQNYEKNKDVCLFLYKFVTTTKEEFIDAPSSIFN